MCARFKRAGGRLLGTTWADSLDVCARRASGGCREGKMRLTDMVVVTAAVRAGRLASGARGAESEGAARD